MKIRLAVVAVTAMWGGAVCHATMRVAQDASPRSVLDGVYTEEQAARGRAVYKATCAPCHGNVLEGGEEAPPLVGAAFLSNWNGSTLGDLFDRTRKSMPDSKPGTLTKEQYADVLAFQLQANRFPAGKAELAPQSELLRLIKIEPIKSAFHNSRPPGSIYWNRFARPQIDAPGS